MEWFLCMNSFQNSWFLSMKEFEFEIVNNLNRQNVAESGKWTDFETVKNLILFLSLI